MLIARGWLNVPLAVRNALLKQNNHEIQVDAELREQAMRPLKRMLNLQRHSKLIFHVLISKSPLPLRRFFYALQFQTLTNDTCLISHLFYILDTHDLRLNI